MGDVGVADGLFARPDAFEEVAGVAVAAVKVDFIGSQRFADNVGRVRNERAAVHGDAAIGADEASAAFAADWFARVGLAIDNHAVGVLVTGAAFLHERLHGSGIVRVRGPLNDVVVVLAP